MCWVDANGNEVSNENIGPVEVYGEGEAVPTLVVDANQGVVKQVGDNETYPYICQSAVPQEGK